MKSALILLCLFVFPPSAEVFAGESPEGFLIKAITNCPYDSNPLRVMELLGGNLLSVYPDSMTGTSVEAEVVFNLQIKDSLILTPVRNEGTFRVEMTYPTKWLELVCKLYVKSKSEGSAWTEIHPCDKK